MQVLFKKSYEIPETLENDFGTIPLREEIENIRQALELAYAGFDYAIDPDMIDCYIYEINSLQKRYKHLCDLAAVQNDTDNALTYTQTPVPVLIGQS